MNDDVFAYLRCPSTKQSLRPLPEDAVAKLNARIEAGEVMNQAGNRIERPVGAALVTEDRRLIYPVWDEIISLIADEAIESEQAS